MPSSDEIHNACTNVLTGHQYGGALKPLLQNLSDQLSGEEDMDIYGSGDYLQEFEAEIAHRFGKEAAVFMPSGTMAQQIAMKIWCERSGNDTVAMHPSAHLEFAEQLGYQYLTGLKRLQFGVPELVGNRMLTLHDFKSLGKKPGGVLLELPYRPLGGCLPAWDDLVAISAWCKENQIPLHLDGARIWQCRPYYQKSYADIASLFDSLYVSFYKDLGALSGCMLAGPESFIHEAKIWQRRYGGNLFTMAPNVVSAKLACDQVIPQIDQWVIRAQEIANILSGIEGIKINPDPPHVNFFQVFAEGKDNALNEAHLSTAEKTGTWAFSQFRDTEVPGIAVSELHCFDNSLIFDEQILNDFVQQMMTSVQN